MQRDRLPFWLCFLVVTLALAGLFLAPPAQAQGDTAIQVVTSAARAEFPARISFALEAESRVADIVAVQLLYGATRQQVLTVVDLEVAPRRQVSLQHDLDTQVFYYPPGTAISYRWWIRDAAGNEVTTPLAEVRYHDERFPWSERSARNVTIYWYGGGEAFGETLLGAVVRALDRLEAVLGAGLEQPVQIYIYASNSDMRSALQANSVEWVGGEAHTELGVIIGAIEPGDRSEAGRLIPHELSHQVLAQLTANPYGGVPLWFDEGLAMYAQEQRDAGYDEQLAAAARAGRLIPLEALAASFPADTDQALLSYAQSRAVVAYLIERYGVEQVRELALAFATAMPVDEALLAVLGRSVDALDAEWRATLPPADQVMVATPAPQQAPPERFAEAPLASPAGPEAGPWFTRLPPWALLAGAGLCCSVATLVVIVVVLVGLRFLGVDQGTA